MIESSVNRVRVVEARPQPLNDRMPHIALDGQPGFVVAPPPQVAGAGEGLVVDPAAVAERLLLAVKAHDAKDRVIPTVGHICASHIPMPRLRTLPHLV